MGGQFTETLSQSSPEHSVRDRGVAGSNPVAPTKIDQENRPSIDGHRRLKAIFVGDSRRALRESRKSFENMLDSESFMSGSRRPFSVDLGGKVLP